MVSAYSEDTWSYRRITHNTDNMYVDLFKHPLGCCFITCRATVTDLSYIHPATKCAKCSFPCPSGFLVLKHARNDAYVTSIDTLWCRGNQFSELVHNLGWILSVNVKAILKIFIWLIIFCWRNSACLVYSALSFYFGTSVKMFKFCLLIINNGYVPLSRTLFFFLRFAHVIPSRMVLIMKPMVMYVPCWV